MQPVTTETVIAELLVRAGYPVGNREQLVERLSSLGVRGLDAAAVADQVFASIEWDKNLVVREVMARGYLGQPFLSESAIIDHCVALNKKKPRIEEALKAAINDGTIVPVYTARRNDNRMKYEFVLSVRVNVRKLHSIRSLWDRGSALPHLSAEAFASELITVVNDRGTSERTVFPSRKDRPKELERFFASINHIVVTDAKILQGSMDREVEFGLLSDHPTEHIGAFVRDGVSGIEGVTGTATLPVAWRFARDTGIGWT